MGFGTIKKRREKMIRITFYLWRME